LRPTDSHDAKRVSVLGAVIRMGRLSGYRRLLDRCDTPLKGHTIRGRTAGPSWHAVGMTGAPTITDADAWNKWAEMAPLIDRMVQRVNTDGEFPVSSGSSLDGDDQAGEPYQVSHVVRLCINAGVDHLHAVKVLVFDNHIIHLAAPASLARGALETFSAAYWVLNPAGRDERVTRALRWHAKNFRDADIALASNAAASLQSNVAALDRVAARRRIDQTDYRNGYRSSTAVKYADDVIDRNRAPLGVLRPWQICSGFAHGRPWAYLGFLSQKVSSTQQNGVVNVQLTSDITRSTYPTLAAMQLLECLLHLYETRASNHLARNRPGKSGDIAD
jgi:hypothetical protein